MNGITQMKMASASTSSKDSRPLTPKARHIRPLESCLMAQELGKLGDCRLVPYKLPDLQQATAAGRVVYITEGEKAADALGSLGVVATTSHAGAGGWNEELNQYFKDANVVIVPDNDLVGWSYAQKVVEALLPTGKERQGLGLEPL
jgi:hypothetical protein